jgi:replication-associated recombination protein RarA
MRAAEEHGSLMPPAHILNAPTKLMKNLGYGKGYEYDHDAPKTRSPARTIFPTAWRGSVLRAARHAASSARSPSGWNIGRSCGSRAFITIAS